MSKVGMMALASLLGLAALTPGAARAERPVASYVGRPPAELVRSLHSKNHSNRLSAIGALTAVAAPPLPSVAEALASERDPDLKWLLQVIFDASLADAPAMNDPKAEVALNQELLQRAFEQFAGSFDSIYSDEEKSLLGATYLHTAPGTASGSSVLEVQVHSNQRDLPAKTHLRIEPEDTDAGFQAQLEAQHTCAFARPVRWRDGVARAAVTLVPPNTALERSETWYGQFVRKGGRWALVGVRRGGWTRGIEGLDQTNSPGRDRLTHRLAVDDTLANARWLSPALAKDNPGLARLDRVDSDDAKLLPRANEVPNPTLRGVLLGWRAQRELGLSPAEVREAVQTASPDDAVTALRKYGETLSLDELLALSEGKAASEVRAEARRVLGTVASKGLEAGGKAADDAEAHFGKLGADGPVARMAQACAVDFTQRDPPAAAGCVALLRIAAAGAKARGRPAEGDDLAALQPVIAEAIRRGGVRSTVIWADFASVFYERRMDGGGVAIFVRRNGAWAYLGNAQSWVE